MHTIPYFSDDRPEAKNRRKIWIDFVKAKRVILPSKSSCSCSAHFKLEDFERRFHLHVASRANKTKFSKIKMDEVGICVFPSIHAEPKSRHVINETQSETQSTSTLPSNSAGYRSRQMVSYFLLIFLRIFVQFLF